MALSDTVRDLVEGALAPLDLQIYDVEHTGGTLRVTVDRPDGIDIDTVADATRAVSRALDEADPIPGSYHLEVSSPGLERTLRTDAHWASAVGEQVKVKLVPGVEGDRRVEGTVARVGDGEATIDVDGEERTVRLGDVERAKTVFVGGPAPKPGGPKSGGPKSGGQKSATTGKPVSGRTKENHQ